MLEIPKIVRQRLSARAEGGAHPDANLLTAFAEQTLARRERDSILTHLSQCSDCRDVVFLAAPQMDIETEVVPVRSSWLGWPALRWGAVAACAVVVVAAVSLRQRSDRLTTFKETLPQVATKADESAAPQKTQVATELQKDRAPMDYKSRADVAEQDRRVSKPAPKARGDQAPASLPQAGPALAGSLASEKAAPRDLDAFAKTPAPAAPPARAAEQMVATESSVTSADSVEASLGKAKQAVQSNLPAENKVAKLEAPAAAVAMGGAQAVFKKITPRWTLSADGTLQRSLDAGKTWKTIPVAADATLTAVAAMDSDIWVGGSHGSLYHSTDAGDHWTQVVPTTGGQRLTSNVIGIEFPDALHGKITTADQEIWTTSDGGQSWQVSH